MGCTCSKSPARSTSKRNRGIDWKAALSVFGDMKDVSGDVAIQAFDALFKSDSKSVDFRELYTGLSLVIGNKIDDRIKFIFTLFDKDWDGQLSKSEVEELLQTSIVSFRKFSKGPGKQEDEEWIQQAKKELLEDDQKEFVTYDEFKEWAGENLNVESLLNTDGKSTSPQTEAKEIIQTL